MKRTAVVLLIFCGCSEINIPDDIGVEGAPDEAPFVNLDDVTTEAISSNIPRLEVSVSGDLITAFISVTDQEGNPIENFTIGNYLIQEIVANDTTTINAQLIDRTNTETDPLAVSINMDYSGSMELQDIIEMERAIKSFIRLKNEQDIFSIIKFASSVDIVQTFTRDTSLLISAVNKPEKVSGGTAFYDACQAGLDELGSIGNNYIPVVIGFTDGSDGDSFISLDNLINNAISSSIPVYTIGLGSVNSAVLSQLSNSTGGRFSLATSNADIQQLYDLLDNQLSSLYEVQWTSTAVSGSNVVVLITVEYTSANGTFTDQVTSNYTAP